MLYINPLTKLNIIPFKFNACWKFYIHKYATTLVLLKIMLFVALLYMYDGYFNFSMITILHLFNFNLMTNKSAPNRKVLEHMKFFCLKSTTFNTRRRTYHSVALPDNKSYSQASCLCSDTKLLLCDTLSVSKFSANLEKLRPIEWQSILATYILNVPVGRDV